MVMYKIYIIAAVVFIGLVAWISHQSSVIDELAEQKQTLQDNLEGQLEASKRKEKRNEEELQRLSKDLAKLQGLSSEWRLAPLPDDVLEFLHKHSKDSDSTFSIAPSK